MAKERVGGWVSIGVVVVAEGDVRGEGKGVGELLGEGVGEGDGETVELSVAAVLWGEF